MTNADSWKELREFDNCEPSPLTFRAMVALLDKWPADDHAEAIAYADQLLSEWPDTVRIAPWSWCKAASKGIVQPTWHLVRALKLTSGHLTKEAVDLADSHTMRTSNTSPNWTFLGTRTSRNSRFSTTDPMYFGG